MNANEAYELRRAADQASNLARKALPPVLGEVVRREVQWLKDSTWTANQERLRLLISEINALVDAYTREVNA